MNQHIFRKSFLWVAISASVMSAHGVHAEQATQDENMGLEGLDEVIVTARRMDENIQEVPISMTVFTGFC